MKSIIITIVTLVFTSVLAYHDPDLNYHLSQVQKLQDCGDTGYSYPAPAVQLSAAPVKVAPAPVITQSVVSGPATYQYSNIGYSNAEYANAGYNAGYSYQAPTPKITYTAPPAPSNAYLPSTQSNYAGALVSREYHGYTTSAGLSAVAAPRRTVIPQATYAQAPIIAKVTAAPLIAKFALSPAKTTYVSQNSVLSTGVATSAAKASLNSYSAVQSGGPVVSQVYAAPSSGYATSPALRVQQGYTYSAPTVAQYHQASAQQSAAVSQYATSSSNAASSSQYFSPAVAQYSAPAVAQYAAPVVAKYSAPAAPQYVAQPAPVTQYAAAPAPVTHIAAAPAVQYSVPTTYAQYSAPSVQYSTGKAIQYANSGASSAQYTSGARLQYAAPAVAHVSAPVAVAPAAPRVAAHQHAVKNVHTEFLENYDAHPRYAYEYAVNDPHTGDIKQQKEERDGEVVKGQYSLVEPDGSVRTVNYVADWETGFHADVTNSKQNKH